MAFPSNLVRTKNWGTETLTDTDLEGQLDLIINWIDAMADESSGHKHDGTANEGPKIILSGAGEGITGTLGLDNGGTGQDLSTNNQGDVYYDGGANGFTRLTPGTAGKALTTGGAGANPSYEGMTTQGDIEYHNGTTRARLAAGTDRNFLMTQGAGADPAYNTLWATSGATVYNSNSPTSWTDLDLSATVGAKATMVMLKVANGGGSAAEIKFRQNGHTDEIGNEAGATFLGGGCSAASISASKAAYIWITTDASGIVEWDSASALSTTIVCVGYVR